MPRPAPSAPPPADSPERLLVPPAVALIVTGIFGILFNGVQIGIAIFDQDTIRELSKELPQKFPSARGMPAIPPTYSAAVGFVGTTLAGFTLTAGICMLRRKAYGLAATGAILAMLNLGNFCCLVGLPVGLWALVVLWRDDVRGSFGGP